MLSRPKPSFLRRCRVWTFETLMPTLRISSARDPSADAVQSKRSGRFHSTSRYPDLVPRKEHHGFFIRQYHEQQEGWSDYAAQIVTFTRYLRLQGVWYFNYTFYRKHYARDFAQKPVFCFCFALNWLLFILCYLRYEGAPEETQFVNKKWTYNNRPLVYLGFNFF